MYSINFLKSAERDLRKLSSPISKRIIKKLNWLAENFTLLKPMELKGGLTGLYKLRRL
jgi:mRNA interferase RelE/StbE